MFAKPFGVVLAAAAVIALCTASSTDAADVHLNEYNAVGSMNVLEAGASDTFWGIRTGNGGNWFELVVITDHLDMRDWTVEVVDDAGLGTEESWEMTFTADDAWSDLRSGTIITISDDLGNNVGDYHPSIGQWWINVRAHPNTAGTYMTLACLAPACLPADADWNTSNDNTQITIKDDIGAVVFGPAGEGINPPGGVGSDEVFKLEQHPSATVTPTSNFNDGRSSTFGSPNEFGASLTQDFSTLRSVVPYSVLTNVRINEVMSHPASGDDWIELVNLTGGAVDISGWFISDSFDTLTDYEFPPGTIIPAFGYLVFDSTTLGFGLSAACGDQVVLSQGNGTIPTGPRDFIEFGPVENSVTLGRTPDGIGSFGRMAAPTQGSANSGFDVGPVVINEIMYHPAAPGALGSLEYIELLNTSGADVDLTTDFGVDGVHPWRISGGVDFQFEPGTTIDEGETLLVVDFDPLLAPTTFSEFRDAYGLPSNVAAVGPFEMQGNLSNFSETIRLRKPDTPEPENCNGVVGPFVPGVIVDEVTYLDFAPWPEEADGDGPSLERVDTSALGNDPVNWTASLAQNGTPGNPNSTSGILSKDQQKCVSALNKDLEKVTATFSKHILSCMKSWQKQSLSTTMEVCVLDDTKNKKLKAAARVSTDLLKRCTGSDKSGIPKLPYYGPVDDVEIVDAGEAKEPDLFHDIYGPDLNVSLIFDDDDPFGSKCQQSIAKTLTKCQSTTMREFNSCKKSGMKAEAITDATSLGACLGVDAKGKIAKACSPTTGKVLSDINSRCVPLAVDLAAAFPGCNEAVPGDLATCIDERVKCRTCLVLNAADNLTNDCDLFDNGVADVSCN